MYKAIRRAITAIFLPLDRVCNRIFTSAWNPLYRSGTLAFVFMLVATGTGLYLIFFYSLADPHGSLVRIQEQAWLGRWIRALHRYASSAAVACAIIHAFRMFSQGKNWGKRTLAWMSGVLLVILLCITAWSGYLLLWDESALALNTALTRIVDHAGISASPLSHSFNGVIDLPLPSFFFLILFMHVVLPLGLVFGLWLHTSRLARASWFPSKPLIKASVGLLVVTAILIPAPLGEPANLLKRPLAYTIDLWTSAWVPWALSSNPMGAIVTGILVLLMVLSVPFWLRPRKKEQPPASSLDPKDCVGCGRCAEDCPYEAIQMIPRVDNPTGELSNRLALVDPSRCVSCAICSASCLAFTIGPEGRKGSDQMQRVEQFLSDSHLPPDASEQHAVILSCHNQAETLKRLEQFATRNERVHVFPGPCVSTIHPNAIEKLTASFAKVIIAACPPRNCTNKDGFFLLEERLAGKRTPPAFSDKSLLKRIEVIPTGSGEEGAIEARLTQAHFIPKPGKPWSACIAGLALLMLISLGSALPIQNAPDKAALRLSWRLTDAQVSHIQERTPEELNKLPIHMRKTEIDIKEAVPMRLQVWIDDELHLDRTLLASGLRNDGPLYVAEELTLPVGEHQIKVLFDPQHPKAQQLKAEFEQTLNFAPGQINLITQHPDSPTLYLHQPE